VATTARFVLRCIRLTARTVRAHLVTDDAAVAGRRTRHYRAVCGELVLAASLITPERGSCRACLQWRQRRKRGTAGSLGGRGCRMRVAASPLIGATPRAQGGA